MIKVVVLGAGNVGSHLCKTLQENPNVLLLQNYNRKGAVIKGCNVPITTNLLNIASAEVYIVTYNDNSLHECAKDLSRLKGLVVHTSGATKIDVFSNLKNYGVLYPVQSFNKDLEINFKEVPIGVEANTKVNENLLLSLAQSISDITYRINSEQRKALHVAAVFANNFSNFMYTQAKDVCDNFEIDFNILKPIIKETIAKIEKADPKDIQTGPAIRNDSKTIEQHKLLLKDNKQKKIYTTITKAIQTYYEKEL